MYSSLRHKCTENKKYRSKSNKKNVTLFRKNFQAHPIEKLSSIIKSVSARNDVNQSQRVAARDDRFAL